MGMSRTGKLIASCCGAAIVVAAAGVVWIGVEEGRTASGLVPAKLGPEEAGGVTSPASTQGVPGQPTAGAQNATVGPVPIPGTEGTVPGSITESLVLQKGETYYDKGEAFFKDGDFTSASRYLEAEVRQHPDRFYASYLLGISLWKEGKRDEAIASLTSAASFDPRSVKARVNLGRVLNDAGRFEQALSSADEAFAIDPESSPVHNVRGRALLNLGREDEAIESFKIAVEKDPANAYALNNLGYTLIRKSRFAEAVPFLEEAVRRHPEVGYFQNNLGMAYERTGQTDKAKEAYAKAVQAGGSGFAERNLTRLGGTIDDATPGQPVDDTSN